ncbi:hypothetical protein B0H19DRAFT_523825 [Mycena capillaripes]|nr:hypothetical protein B0H19DRAFT_523825 [Mycena capillaripes]
MSIFLPLVSDLLVLLLILSQAALSLGSVQTATIDDTNGDSKTGAQPVYNPADSFSPNSNCDGCTVHANPASAFDGTWHDISQFGGAAPASITLSFTGTAIEVFCILAATLTTDLAFTLDGSPQKSYSRTPGSTPDYIYGENVFSISGLVQTAHQLTVATNNPSGSLLLFDYAKYSFEVQDVAPPPPPPPPPTTDHVTNVVTQISTKQVTTQITTTDVQTTAQASINNGAPVSNPNTSAANHSGSPSATHPTSSPNNAASNKGSSSATLTDGSVSTPSASSLSSSSLAPPAISSSKTFNYIPVLLGILIPAILIVVLGVLFFRRRRAQRANIPDMVSHNGSFTAPLFASQAPSVYTSNSSRLDSGSHRTLMGFSSENGDMERDMERGPWGPESGGSSTASGGDIQMGENHNFVASSSASPIQHDPSSSALLSRSLSTYTFETSPPPQYSSQRPLPTIPSVPALPHK